MSEKLFEQMDLLSNGSDEEGFLFFIDLHKDLLKENPIRFIGNHISFYANKEDVIKSLQVVEFYKSAPYISMEVEDFLNEMKEELLKLHSHKKNEYSLVEIERFLFSDDENKIVNALHFLSRKNIRTCLNLVKKFLVSKQLSKYKSLALFILVEQSVDEEIKIIKDGSSYSINPSKLILPFDNPKYKKVIEVLERKNDNAEIVEIAKEILNTIQIKMYPQSMIERYNEYVYGDIFIEVAKKFMILDYSISHIASSHELDINEINNEINKIIEVFNS